MTKEELLELEKASKQLDITEEERVNTLQQVAKHVLGYLNYLETEPAFTKQEQSSHALEHQLKFDENPSELNIALDYIQNRIDKGGISPSNGGHLGYIPGGGIFESGVADLLANISNRYAGIAYASPGAVRMENSLIDWAAKLIGYNSGFGGNLTSGGSIANLIGINTARHSAGFHSRDTEKQVIYLSEQSHHSIDKAIKICGLHDCKIQHIALDANYRIDPEDLEQKIKADLMSGLQPFIVVANAGTTDVGAVDPIFEISELCSKHKLWLHVDAAYGGFFKLCESKKHLLDDLHLADSVVLDPHKGLFLPYGSGIVIVKDIEKMRLAHAFTANYMQDAQAFADEPSPAELSPELTKPFRGLRLWLPLKVHGLDKFRTCLEEKLGLAQYMYDELVKLGFECPIEPELSVVIYRLKIEGYDSNELNKELHQFVLNDGKVFISSTTLNGEFTLRAAILHLRTHLEEIDHLLRLFKQFKEQKVQALA